VFGWFRKKTVPPDVEAQIKAIYDVCVAALTKVWLDIDPRTTTIEELAVEINKFGTMATEVMFTKFPIMKQAPAKLIWLIVCTAVLESKTHPVDDVNKAIDLLRAQYASPL
jgi:hypothetical protein